MKLFNLPELRMEFVQFQAADLKFEKPALALIETILEKVKAGWESDEIGVMKEVALLEKLILDKFGMNLRIFTSGCMAAILPFHLNQESIFLDKALQSKHILVSMEELRVDKATGWVDEATGQVGGVFSDYPSSLYLNFNGLAEVGLSPREIMAVILHELGHFFYGCWVSSNIDTSNQIINNALKKASSKKDAERIEFVFREIQKNNKSLPDKLLDDLTSKNPIVAGRGLMTILGEVGFSQLENAKYDNTAFEQMADNFATRFGYGTELVTALHKVGGEVSFVSEMFSSIALTYRAAEALAKSFFLIRLLISGVNSIFMAEVVYGAIISVINTFFFAYLLLGGAGEAGRSYTYDDFPVRYKRIRLQLVELIKQKDLTNKDIKALIDKIEMISKTIGRGETYRGPLDFLFNTLNPKDRRAKNSIERQQAIEALFGNELFVKSLELKSML
jgi:hypothetical protein